MIEYLTDRAQAAIGDGGLVQQSADASEVDEKAVGLHRSNLAFHQLAHFQILKPFSNGSPFFGQHQLACL